MQKNKRQDIIFGLHPLLELLKAKRRKILTLYTTKPLPKAGEHLLSLLPPATQIQYVSRDVLTRLAQSSDHQGFVAYATPFSFRSKPFEAARSPFIIMLDGIQDPRNLGAILRSAYCTGVNGVIIPKKSSAPLNAVALKASAGLAEHMEIYQAASPSSAIQELKKEGYAIYLAALGGQNALTTAYKLPLCLVIGSEGKGISPEISRTGTIIMIPQKRPDISYNASVAAGILLCTITQKITS